MKYQKQQTTNNKSYLSPWYCNEWVWEFFHRRVSLFRRRGNRGSIFRNEWVWEFFHWRISLFS